MSMIIEEGCEIHCDGIINGRKCGAVFVRYRYRTREEVIKEALTCGYIYNPKTGCFYCRRCAQKPQPA